MNIKPFAFPALALIGAFSPTAYAMPAVGTDQVIASFERLLNHTPADTAVAVPAGSKAGADPLLAGVNTVPWKRLSYHPPDKYAYFPVQVKPKS